MDNSDPNYLIRGHYFTSNGGICEVYMGMTDAIAHEQKWPYSEEIALDLII